MIENFFAWMRKHEFFFSGIIVITNLIASIQCFSRGDYTWGTIDLLIALTFWYLYVKKVNDDR